jgi:uncharacterized protein YecE (DUF72 family)
MEREEGGMTASFFIGTSGWHYDDWQGSFYPEGLPRSAWLGFYSQRFRTVELNNTFYRLPTEKAFHNWYSVSPDDFIFAVKVSRFITHIKRIKDCQEPLHNFLSRAGILNNKLGPLLYQLPPSLQRDDSLLESFLIILPRGLRHVFEFRHDSWLEEDVFDLLRRYRAGLCVFDMPGVKFPLVTTSDFGYIRFHGSSGLYRSCYTDAELLDWATRVKSLSVSRVYIYFNNDEKAYAVQNAQTMARLLESG